MTPEDVASRADGARARGEGQWDARCPAHEDMRRSLAIGTGRDGRVLLRCMAGCATEAVVSGLGLEMRDIMPDSDRLERSRIVATYDYMDAKGKLLYQVVRLEPKSFRQRRPDGRGGWDWKSSSPVLYRLPAIARSRNKVVMLVEGEKDADRLTSIGFIATTISGGASREVPPSTWSPLSGRMVAIIPDNDAPGAAAARRAHDAIYAAGGLPAIVALSGPEKSDASDWLDAGGTAVELTKLAREALYNSAREHIRRACSAIGLLPQSALTTSIKTEARNALR